MSNKLVYPNIISDIPVDAVEDQNNEILLVIQITHLNGDVNVNYLVSASYDHIKEYLTNLQESFDYFEPGKCVIVGNTVYFMINEIDAKLLINVECVDVSVRIK